MRKKLLWLMVYLSIVLPYIGFEFFLMYFFEKSIIIWDLVKGGLWGSGVFFLSVLYGYVFTPRKKNIPEKLKINLNNYKPKRGKYRNKC